MFDLLARVAQRRPRTLLLLAAAATVAAMVWGPGIFEAVKAGGFEAPDAESYRAAEQAEEIFGRTAPDVMVIYSSERYTVDDPAFAGAVDGALAGLPDDTVIGAQSYWSLLAADVPPERAASLVSPDRRSALVTLQLAGEDESERIAGYREIEADLAADGLDLLRGGQVATAAQVEGQSEADFIRAEALAAPILLVLLLLIFGGVVAAALPLLIGFLAVLGAFTALRLITLATDVSIFAINVVSIMGIALAIDYALFIVMRYREELSHGSPEPALRRTMTTAGRTVAFSGVTIAIAFAGLLFFPQPFLRSIGFGGIAVVLVLMVISLTVLPAILALLGRRVDALSIPWLRGRRRAAIRDGDQRGLWGRLAAAIMRRPAPFLSGSLLVLLALGLPFLVISFGTIDVDSLPTTMQGRQVADTLDEFGVQVAPVQVLYTGPDPDPYLRQLAQVEGVTGVEVAQAGPEGALVDLTHRYESDSPQAREVVRDIRDLPGDAMVTGASAVHEDQLASIARILPWAVAFVVLTSIPLLFAAFGSLVLPVKAIIVSALSLGATLGVIVWGFQEGNLGGLLGFAALDSIDPANLVLVVLVAFGLSLDYELFLLTRMREEWDRTGDNRAAIANGMRRTGRLITYAAILITVVLASFASAEIAFMKMIGVGLAVAVVVDATLVRGLLVPATMRLLGNANWWLPRPLRRVYEAIAIREEDRPDRQPESPRAAPGGYPGG